MDFTTPSPARERVLDTITALGSLTMSSFRSGSTKVGGSEADDSEAEDEEMESSEMDEDDSPCRPSIENDTIVVTRDFPPPNLAWARKVAITSRQKSFTEDSDVGFSGAGMDYGDLEDRSDGGDSNSSDWEGYGPLGHTAADYNTAVSRIDGSNEWNEDQKKLHKLIYMRGLHPMMPSWWRMSFKMWGVTQPHLDDVFAPNYSRKRVAIHAHGNEMAATKAVESLFYLSQIVTDFEELGSEEKIAGAVVKGVRGYIKWAMRDLGVDQRKSQLNMLVRAYPPEFRGDDDSEEDMRYDLDSDETDQRRALRFTRAVSRDLEKRLRSLGQEWRSLLRKKKGTSHVPQPPTLYAFAVIQHVVMVVSHDPASANNSVVVLDQVQLNERGQWLWNALSIALPINLARDALDKLWGTGALVRYEEDHEDDPDL
ncbi:uncharacterized protein C8A04DRAFT_14374 [Dichotomopilus funicola]|uniref:Uncharacterized protein n=1 Tax=Dichotomopilus funicola TaxID=1934379 RepID=A0AAN6UXY9_9PEZI|nr:hypothetical protein C8A04DRAFT_14374 [Dichotomopilus funicola]